MKLPKTNLLSLTVERKYGMYWVRDKTTGRVVSTCFNKPTKFMLDTMSRATSWTQQVKTTAEDLVIYKGNK